MSGEIVSQILDRVLAMGRPLAPSRSIMTRNPGPLRIGPISVHHGFEIEKLEVDKDPYICF